MQSNAQVLFRAQPGPLGSVYTKPWPHLWKYRLPLYWQEGRQGVMWCVCVGGGWVGGWEPWKIPMNHDGLLVEHISKMRKLNKSRKKGSERKVMSENGKEKSLSKPLCEFSIYFSSQSPEEGQWHGPREVIQMSVKIKLGIWNPNIGADRYIYVCV